MSVSGSQTEESSAAEAGEIISVNGMDVHFRSAGDGPALLLLHGYTGAGIQWDKYVEEFSGTYTVIAPDLPGHSRSTNPFDYFSMRETAKSLLSLLDELGHHRVSGIGYSLGGMVLLHMAAKQPARFEALILTASAHRTAGSPEGPPPGFEDLPEAYQNDLRRNHLGDLSKIRTLLTYRAKFEDAELNPGLTLSQLGEISTRILLMCGDRDEEGFTVPIILELHQALRDSQMWIVPGAGHPLYWTEWGGSRTLEMEFPKVALRFLGNDSGN